MIHFTSYRKDDLLRWVCERTHKQPLIRGMDELLDQITKDGKINYNSDKDGFFFQAQITRQLDESERCDVTRVEDKGITYDIDIELDRYICIQAHLGGNVVGHDLDRKVAKSDSFPAHYSEKTCSNEEDLNWLQRKLDQLNKPILDGDVFGPSGADPVKILVTMSPTRLPLHFLPEWNRLLKDRITIELRGDFDGTGNLRGMATLHRADKQWDKVAKNIVGALGFRYVESFSNLGAGPSSVRFGGLQANAWQSSYLNTASQRILLQPKVMVSALKPDMMAGWIMDSTGREPSPELVNSYLGSELRYVVNQVIWADVEQPNWNGIPILGAYRLESFDRLIANRNLAKNGRRPGLYNLYDGKINRDKT
ncbi:MAG: hypothetical protein IS632_09290 [Thaumarchaeota archaeon]|nr:hypothetical protein [Nitrososphaerota archaeon]